MLGAMDTLLALPLLLGIPVGYLWLQVCLLRRWVGAWRVAAALPAIGWLVWLAGFARDVSVDPTSHNLFPFEILIGVVLAGLYLSTLVLARWLLRPGG
ncbi:MAG: hypothetical protein AB7I59_21615 [Geminicoccaceae bacterium]